MQLARFIFHVWGEDGLGGVDPVLYQQDWDHVLDGIVDEVVGTSNLLEKVLGVMEGLIRGGYYLDSIFDPSAVDRSGPYSWAGAGEYGPRHTWIINPETGPRLTQNKN